MKILVTGVAGFIGMFVAESLLKKGHSVVGIDNINDYYDVDLKFGRLAELGIPRPQAEKFNVAVQSINYADFKFVRIDITDRPILENLFTLESFEVVCHLAAQAGVRYSLENPESYVQNNLVGFAHILECCRHHSIKHLVYASSSSVYGMNKKIPFETTDRVDNPVSLYAATKKSNELMAHTYSHLYGLRTTGLRFFTVYGPWGRPDMAMFLFTKAILKGEPINVFNEGNLERDFTYIDDIAEGVTRVIESKRIVSDSLSDLYRIYNIGNSKSVKLMDFIDVIEKKLGKKAQKKMLPMQPGDVERTWANVDDLVRDYDYQPNTPIKKGVEQFVNWFRYYYGL